MIRSSKIRLERLKEQREKINTRIQLATERLKKTERKKDTRKKILVGSYYLDQAKKESGLQKILSDMDKYLTREADRALFELAPLAGEKES